jgi:hypothetical protein
MVFMKYSWIQEFVIMSEHFISFQSGKCFVVMDDFVQIFIKNLKVRGSYSLHRNHTN